MEDKPLPPGQSVSPTVVSNSLESAGADVPVASLSASQKTFPLETLEVHPEAGMGGVAPKSNRPLPFSRKKATIVSLAITFVVVIFTGLVSAFLVNQKKLAVPNSNLNNIPANQDVDFEGSLGEVPPELKGAEKALLVNGDIIAKGDLKVTSGDFASIIRTDKLTADSVLTLPNASGTICVSSNNCNYASVEQLNAQTTTVNQHTVSIEQIQNQLAQIVIPPAGVTSLNNQAGAVSIQGSLNQVTVTTSNGTITLSTPQDLASISSPTFASLLLNGGLTVTGTITTGLDCTGNTNEGALTANGSGQIICSNDDGGAGGGAPTTASYLVASLDAALSAERALAAGSDIQFTDGGANGNFTIAVVENPTFSTSVTTPLLTSTGVMAITPGGALTVGAVGQTALLQGSTTTITSSGGNDIVLNSGDTIELQDNTNVTGSLVVNGTGTFQGASLTVGAAAQVGSLVLNDGSSNIATLQIAPHAANRVYTFPDAGADADVCLSTGNCVGGSGGAPNNAAYLTIGNNATLSGERAIAVNATNLSFADGGANGSYTINTIQNIATTSTPTFGGLTLNGALSLSGNTIQGTTAVIDFTNFDVSSGGSVTAAGNLVIQGGSATLGVASSATGSLAFQNSTNANTVTFQSGVTSTSYTLTLPTAVGAANQCLKAQNGTGTLFFDNCTGGAGGGLSGSGTLNRVAKFTPNGTTIGDSTISDDGTNVSITGDFTLQGGDITVGTTSQLGSVVLHDGNGQTSTLRAGDSSGNLTFILPTAAGGTNQCIKQSSTANQLFFDNCDGGAGGSSVNSFQTIGVPAGTAPVADSATDTLSLTVTGTNLTVTGNAGTDTIDFDISESTLAGAGLVANGNALDVVSGNGAIDVNANDITFDLNHSFAWTADHTWTLVDGEDLAVGSTLTGTTSADPFNLSLTNQTSSGTQRALTVTNVDDAVNATTEALAVLNNAETTANTVTDYLLITSSATDTTADAIDVSDADLFNAINIGTNFLVASGDSINDFTGNGLQVSSNALTLALQANKGLEVDGNGLSLIDCATNEILKYNGSNQWACAADAGGSGVGDDVSVNGVAATNANFIDTATSGTVAGVTWSLNTTPSPDEISITISNASATDAGVVTTGSQTFAGAKTFNGQITAGAGINLGAQTLQGTTAVIDFTNFDVSSGGAVTAVGTINTTGGALQTNSVTRIDNSGNLTNIGNLTATGAITVASSGAGNDITIDGADQFIVQDSAVFNGQAAFNTDVDLVFDDTENFSFGSTVTGTNSVSVLNGVITNNTSSGTQNVVLLQNAAGSGTTDGFLVLDNADTDTAVGAGLVVTSAAGGVTNAIDVSDSDIVNALLFGANDVIGTNFTIAGASGAVTGGTYNGQTISSAASFTGTVNVAGLTTLNGGLTVEAGDTFTFNGDAFTDLTGNGLQVSSNALTLALQANKGLEVDSNGLSLIDCASGEILKYNGSNQWACAADGGASGTGDDITVNGVAATNANFLDGASSGTNTATTWSLNTASNPDDITLTIGNASATAAGAVTTGTQTFAGAKTFNGQITAGAGVDLGTQTLLGTTAVIDFTNFDVSSGGAVTAATSLTTPLVTSTAALSVTSATTLTLQSANGTTSSAVTLQSGNASSGASGNITIDNGTFTSGTPTINLGTTNARAINIGNTSTNTAVTIQGDGSATAVSIQSAASGTITIGTANVATKTISIGSVGSTAQATTINLANTTGNATQIINIGATNSASNAVLIQGGTSSTAISLQAGAAGTIGIGTNAVNSKVISLGSVGTTANTSTVNIANTSGNSNQTVSIGSAGNANSSTTIQGGSTGGINIGASGTPVNFNSVNMFVPNDLNIQGSESIFYVSTNGASARKVGIGTVNPGARLHIVQKNDGIDEGFRIKDSGSNAAINLYYNNPGALAYIDVVGTYEMGHITSLAQAGKLSAGRVLTLKSFNESSLGGISFDMAGTEIARFNTNNQLVLSDGAVGTPALSFLNDTNTGVYRAGADDLRLAAGGQSELRATADAVFIEERLTLGVDSRTIADNGAGTNATLTLNPNSSYVEITCNDATGCDVTMDEASPVAKGQTVFIVMLTAGGTNGTNFADTAGVTELQGAYSAGQYDTLSLIYIGDRWAELARSNN